MPALTLTGCAPVPLAPYLKALGVFRLVSGLAGPTATAGLDQQRFVSRYLVSLPKPEELHALIENDCALWDQQHPPS